MSYTDVSKYVSTPRSTDPGILLREEQLRTRTLRDIVAQQDREIAEREDALNAMYVEMTGTH
ncbi:hypothetical protein [Mycolicibacterium mengxianglii]|uniref:hypothetical protein n=1 Tax=Mycolicibacterium mengxianglii TaxID=2736649 RepID=UPI0018D080A8|nr:hypothetical protein [Mycolicibacterium mengxianglii]